MPLGGVWAVMRSAGYNPTGTVCALAYHAADALVTKYLKQPGMLA